MADRTPLWPGNKRVAVAINVDLEIWSEGRAPDYSVQSSSLKPGTVSHGAIAWSQYGGKTGVWRVLRMLERHGVPATFSVNAKCAEAYPDAVRQIARSGFDIAGHGYTQDQLLVYMSPEEEQRTIKTVPGHARGGLGPAAARLGHAGARPYRAHGRLSVG